MANLVPLQPAARLVLAGAVDRQRRALLESLAGDRRIKGKLVHALRVAVRRSLATLELTAALGATARPRALRRLRRLLESLSPLRDAQVELRTLRPLLASHAGCAQLAARLREHKRRLKRAAAKRLARFDGALVDQELALVAATLSAAPSSYDGEAVVAALHGELAQRHLRVSRLLARATAEEPRSLHQARLGLKAYRYALDSLGPLLPAAAQELGERIAQLQDRLGFAHDAHVLAQTAQHHAEQSSGEHQRDLEVLAADLDKSSRAAHQNAESSLRAMPFDWPFA